MGETSLKDKGEGAEVGRKASDPDPSLIPMGVGVGGRKGWAGRAQAAVPQRPHHSLSTNAVVQWREVKLATSLLARVSLLKLL